MSPLIILILTAGGALLALIGITWIGIRALERRHPPIGHFVTVPCSNGSDDVGIRVHYTVLGDIGMAAPTMVLLHGASSSLFDFHSSIAAPLGEKYSVVAIDRPGMGYSDRPDGDWMSPLDQANLVEAVMQILGVQTPILIGHSWSGAVVMAHMLAHPERAKAAVLIAPATHSWYSPPALYNRLSRLPVIGWLFRWALVYPLGTLALGEGIKTAFVDGRVPPGYRQRAAIDLVLRPSSWKANADDLCLLNDFLVEQEQRYARISQPVLGIVGDSDQIVWNEIHVGTLARQLENFTLVELRETGHAPHQSATTQTVAAIVDWETALSGIRH